MPEAQIKRAAFAITTFLIGCAAKTTGDGFSDVGPDSADACIENACIQNPDGGAPDAAPESTDGGITSDASAADVDAAPGVADGGVATDASVVGADAMSELTDASAADVDAAPGVADGGIATDASATDGGRCPASTPYFCPEVGCTDFATDPVNCGGCAHGCGKDAECSNGLCQPVVLLGSVNMPWSLDAVNDGVVFSTNGKGVLLCPLEGCTTTPKQLASRGGDYLAAVDSGGIAWVNLYGEFYGCPIDGHPESCQRIMPGIHHPPITTSFFSLGSDVYWLSYVYNGFLNLPTIARCAGLSGGTCMSYFSWIGSAQSDRQPTGPMAADADNVFFFNYDPDNSVFNLSSAGNSCNSSTCKINALRAFNVPPKNLAAHGGAVYWASDLGAVARCLPDYADPRIMPSWLWGAHLGVEQSVGIIELMPPLRHVPER